VNGVQASHRPAINRSRNPGPVLSHLSARRLLGTGPDGTEV
jgi:hypothetical protein